MKRGGSQSALLLAGVLLLACLALGLLAWRSIAEERERAELRYRRQAGAALAAAKAALRAEVEQVAREGALSLAEGVAPAASGARTTAAWDAFDLRLAALERGGDVRATQAELERFVAEAEPADRAAAWIAWGRIQERSETPLAELGVKSYVEAINLGPRLYDARGLKLTWVAQYHWGRGAERSDQAGLLLPLFEELTEGDPGPSRPAVGVLWTRVRDVLRATSMLHSERTRFERLLERDRELDVLRRWRSFHAGAGIDSWVATQREPAQRAFFLPPDPTREAPAWGDLVVIVGTAPPAAGAATRGALLRQALARPEPSAYAELGFELEPLLPEEQPAEGAPIVARHRLSGAFTGAELLVRGTEREAFLAAESQRVRTTLGLVGGTLALLLLGSGLLVRSVRRDAQSARDQRNFVSAVTHELKTPLASIRLLSELLAEGGLDEEQTREFANRMVGETERLDAMVRGVLELARAERGVDPSERERLAPADLAAEALERMGPVAEEAGADLTLSQAERLPALVGDRSGIVGVLVNLLDNAIKYGDLSEPVELRLHADREWVRFHLLDRGPGVPAAARERIFEAFWRAADELTRERPGVGLGLALGRAVAEAHGGELRYAPRAGGGSEFVLELPAEEA